MCRIWLWLWLLAFSSATFAALTKDANVSSTAELRGALMNPGVGVVRVLSGDHPGISIDPANFLPLSIERELVITSDSGHAMLDFGNAAQPLITVAAGGNLTLQGLTISGFYPAQPLAYTTATAMMPLAAVSINSSAASFAITLCSLLVQGVLSEVTAVMPFWQAAMQQGELDSSRSPIQAPMQSDAAAATAKAADAAERSLVGSAAVPQQRVIALQSMQRTYWGGNSILSIMHDVLVLDPNGCVDGLKALAWDSPSLFTALQGSRGGGQHDSRQTLVFSDIVLQAEQFGVLHSAPVGDVVLSSCSSHPTTLNFNRLAQAFVLTQGAVMRLTGGLQLQGAATQNDQARGAATSTNSSTSNGSAFLLLDSIDVSRGAHLQLQDVTVAVADSSNVQQAMQQLAAATNSNSSTALSLGKLPASAGSAADSQGFAVNSWSIGLAGQDSSGGNAEAVAGATLSMENVTVVQRVLSCFPASADVAVASNAAQLIDLMAGARVTAIQIVSDITLQAEILQVSGGGELGVLKLQQPLEIRGCHPNSAAGDTYTIDFTELQGKPVANVYAMLRVSGDLTLRGIPDYEGALGSWPLLPIVTLAGQGYVEFQDVLLLGRTESALQNAGSPFWTSPPSGAAVTAVDDHSSYVHRLLLSGTAAAQLFPGMFSSTSNSSRNLYGYINTHIKRDPLLPTAAAPASSRSSSMSPASVAALVLGVILGLLLLVLLVGGFLVFRRQRKLAGSFAAAGKGAHGWQLCWPSGPGHGSAYDTSNHVPDDPTALYAAANYAEQGDGMFMGVVNDALLRSFISAAGGRPGADHQLSRHQLAASASTIGRMGSNSSRPGGQYGQPWSAQGKQPDSQIQQQQGECDAHVRQTASDVDSRLQHQPGLVSHTAELHTTQTEEGTQPEVAEGGGTVRGQYKQQVFEDARRRLGTTAGDLARSDALVLESVLGEGTFGKVFKGYWKGTLVAVKTMMFPAAMSGKEKREKMAIMETAISASLSHPNIVQMYTYYLRPVLVGHEAQISNPAGAEDAQRLDNSSVGDSTMNAAFLSEGLADSVHSWEVQLVLEYCDQGSLRHLLNKKGAFTLPDGSRDMLLILDTALDVARAMLHLHSENIIHSDLKARNILLKSSGGADGRQFVAKVADFGLSMRIDPTATHVSNVYQGTMTHMAPEVMLQGKLSRGSDVYAFGVLLWELFSGGHAFKGVPRALLGHEVAHRQRRPQFPRAAPLTTSCSLADPHSAAHVTWDVYCRCWESDTSIRPSFQEILAELQRMRERITASVTASSSAPTSEQISNPSAGLPPSGGDDTHALKSLGKAAAAKQQQGEHLHDKQQPQQPNAGSVGGGGLDRRSAAQVVGSLAAGQTLISAAQPQPQQQEHEQQQQQQADARLQAPGTQGMRMDIEGGSAAGATALSAGPLQGMAAAAAAAAGGMSVSAAGPGQHALLLQRQQHVPTRQGSKESIPDHLLQQMSLTVSGDEGWLNEVGYGVTGLTPAAAAAAAAAGNTGVCDGRAAAAAETKARMLPKAASTDTSCSGGDVKSTYVKDLMSSTSSGAPHCLIYGAAAPVCSEQQPATDSTGAGTQSAERATTSCPTAEAIQSTVIAAVGPAEQPQDAGAAATTMPQQQVLGKKEEQQQHNQEKQIQLSGASGSLSGSAGVLGKHMLHFATVSTLIQANKAGAVKPTTPGSTGALPSIEDVSTRLPSRPVAAGGNAAVAAAGSAAASNSSEVEDASRQKQEQQHLPIVQQIHHNVQQQQACTKVVHQDDRQQEVQQQQQQQQQNELQQPPQLQRPVIQQLQQRLNHRLGTPQQQQQQPELHDTGPTTPQRQMIQQQQQQQPSPPYQQQQHRLESQPSDADSDDTSSAGVVHEHSSSSGDFAPTSSSMNSSSARPGAHSGSAAALQAVLSLKAALAKRALSVQRPAVRPSLDLPTPPSALGPVSGPLPPGPAAANPSVRSQSQPLPVLPGATGGNNMRSPLSISSTAFTAAAAGTATATAPGIPAAARAAAAAVLVRHSLDAQQAAAAAAGAWPAGIQPASRWSLDVPFEPGARCSRETRLWLAAAGSNETGAYRQAAGSRLVPYANARTPTAAAAAAAGAWPAGVPTVGRMSLDARSAAAPAEVGLQQQQQQQASAWFPAERSIVEGATGRAHAAAADSRPMLWEAGQHHREGLRAAVSARGGFAGLASQFDKATGFQSGGLNAAGAAALMQQPRSPDAKSPPMSPSARYQELHRTSVRKAVSASQLGYHGAGASAATPSRTQLAATTLEREQVDSLSSGSRGSTGANHPQHSLQVFPDVLQHATSGNSGPGEPALDQLAGLNDEQLQVLAQIVNAAKAQVTLPTAGLAKPAVTQMTSSSMLSGASGLSLQSLSAAQSGQPPTFDRAFDAQQPVLQQQQQQLMQPPSTQLVVQPPPPLQQQQQQQQPSQLDAQHSHGGPHIPAGGGDIEVTATPNTPQGGTTSVLRSFGQQLSPGLPPLQHVRGIGQGHRPRRASAPPQHPQHKDRRPAAQPAAAAPIVPGTAEARQFAKFRRVSAPQQE